MGKLETLRTELEKARKELNDKGYHFDGNAQNYNELMAIKPFEIKYQDVIEKIWPDDAWWQVTGYWDIFDAMMGGLSDEKVIDEIIKHVGKDYLNESNEPKYIHGAKVEYGHTMKEYLSKYGDKYNDGMLWDYLKEDFEDGYVDTKNITYWYLKDFNEDWRYFETDEVSEKLNESQELNEGTSNFPTRMPNGLPLLVFYTWDEFDYMLKNDPDYPEEYNFEDEDGNIDENAYWDAVEAFEQDFWDKNNICVLDEDEQERLEDKLDDFNKESERMAWDADVVDDEQQYGNNLTLEDVKLSIEPGYYSAAYIDISDSLDYLEDDFKEQQIKRFNDFFESLRKEFGLTKLGLAWGPASNGETGYKIINDSLKEEIKKSDREMIADMLKTGALDDINHVKTLSDEEFEKLVDYWVDNYNTKEDHGELEEKKSKKKYKIHYTGDPAKDVAFFNHAMGSDATGTGVEAEGTTLGECELKEGFVGQVVNDFLNIIAEPDLIETLVISDIDADDYHEAFKGVEEDLSEDLRDCDYADFDIGGGKLVINVSDDIDDCGDAYYTTVEELLDDYNGDEVEIQQEGEVLFSGDKSDIDEELLEKVFVYIDTPEYLCINAHCGGWIDDDFEDDHMIFDNSQEAYDYLKELAQDEGYEFYDIVEDTYEYPNGLCLIAYTDASQEDEIEHYCVEIKESLKEDAHPHAKSWFRLTFKDGSHEDDSIEVKVKQGMSDEEIKDWFQHYYDDEIVEIRQVGWTPESLKEEKEHKGPFEIEYWVDEEARDQGLGDIAIETFDNLEDAKAYADKLFGEVASVEVLDTNGDVVYGRYPEDESLKEGVSTDDKHLIDAYSYLENIGGYAYITEYETEKGVEEVNKGFATSEEFDKFIKDLHSNVESSGHEIRHISTMFQGQQADYRPYIK